MGIAWRRAVRSKLSRRICFALAAIAAAAAFSSVSAIVVPLEWREGQQIGWPEQSVSDDPAQISKIYTAAARSAGPSLADQRERTAPRRRISLFQDLNIVAPAAPDAALFTYDFPGKDGPGGAASQTNPQPAHATFSDFTRTGVQLNKVDDLFSSKSWGQLGTIDLTRYVSFSITATAGYELTLSQLTFDAFRSATGPQSGQVSLFLNGSSTAYATFSFSPTTSSTNFAFDFADILAGSNITSVAFRFYGWNAGGNGGQLSFDNVVTIGAISPVPEMNPAACAGVACLIAVGLMKLKRRRSEAKAAFDPAVIE